LDLTRKEAACCISRASDTTSLETQTLIKRVKERFLRLASQGTQTQGAQIGSRQRSFSLQNDLSDSSCRRANLRMNFAKNPPTTFFFLQASATGSEGGNSRKNVACFRSLAGRQGVFCNHFHLFCAECCCGCTFSPVLFSSTPVNF